MTKAARRERAKLLIDKLEILRTEWESATVRTPVMAQTTHDASRRERLKTIEVETALLRLLQSEERLSVQLVVGLLSFVGGSAVTLLVKALFN